MDTGWAVVLGAAIAFVASLSSGFLLPWVRDVWDRKRVAEAERRAELLRALLELEKSLLAYRFAKVQRSGASEAQLRFFGAQSELALVLPTKDIALLDVTYMMFAAVQGDVRGVEEVVGESVAVLNAWYRGEVNSERLIPEIERRARVKFAEDRRSASRVD